MIQTKYNITIQLNDDEFKIAVRDPSRKEKQFLEKLAKDKTAIFEDEMKKEREANSLKIELDEAKSLYETNKELLKEGGITNRLATLLENKSLAKKISELETKRASLAININAQKIAEAFELVAKEKYELLISGDDKTALLSACEEQGVSLTQLWQEIAGEAAKALEKK
jgi:hypothetical protein